MISSGITVETIHRTVTTSAAILGFALVWFLYLTCGRLDQQHRFQVLFAECKYQVTVYSHTNLLVLGIFSEQRSLPIVNMETRRQTECTTTILHDVPRWQL